MKTKTSELTGAALDWAVAKCEGLTLYKDAVLNGAIKRGVWLSGLSIDPNNWTPLAMFNPSTDWAQGGPIIERERLTVMYDDDWKFDPTDPEDNGERWMSNTNDVYYEPTAYGPTILIAAMRCYVASKLGDTVDIPEELV